MSNDNAPVFFNLTKDEVFDLSKLSPGASDFYIGLDWDPSSAGVKVDLDAVLMAVDANGNCPPNDLLECFLYFKNHGRNGTKPDAYYITEDNEDGVDNPDSDIPDDEAIYVTGDKVLDSIQELRVYVVLHNPNGRTLTDVGRIGLRITPLINGVADFEGGSTVKFDVHNIGASAGAYMACLLRNKDGGWDVKSVGEQSGDLVQIVRSYNLPA